MTLDNQKATSQGALTHVKERRKEKEEEWKDPGNKPVTVGKRAVCGMRKGEAGCCPHRVFIPATLLQVPLHWSPS